MIGDRRPFLSALVTLDMEEVAKLAEENGWPADPAELAKNPEMRELIQEHIDEINEKFARVEQVKKFEILPADLSQEGGELTPTLKVKRNVVADKYESDIEALYAAGKRSCACGRDWCCGASTATSRPLLTRSRARFTAGQVAEAIGAGLRAGGAEATLLPAADGGEGTLDALLAALGGERRAAPAHDPLGRPIEAPTACSEDGRTAVVEVAAASGLALVAEGERDAEAASTAGTGELIAAAAGAGRPRGCWSPPAAARPPTAAPGAIEAIEAAGGLSKAKLEVLCDVSVPFERAAEVFAPQKGADPEAVARLTERLTARAGALPRDPRGKPMTGAAGGLSGGLWAAFGARLVPGAAYVLGLLGFDRRLEESDAAVTGEGRLDSQSLEGKLVGEVARRCRAATVPLHAIAGTGRSGRRRSPPAGSCLDRRGRDSGRDPGRCPRPDLMSGIACRRPPLAGAKAPAESLRLGRCNGAVCGLI